MIYVILIVIGLSLGSFINALVWRLHEQRIRGAGIKRKTTKKQPSHQELSILHGRSMCPYCYHELAVRDLVPVLSWLSLHGKCRYCSHRISRQYPIVELLTAALFVLSYIRWVNGFGILGVFAFMVWLAIVITLIALAVYDLKWYILPDRLVWILTSLSVVYVLLLMLIGHDPGIWLGALAGVAIIAGGFYVIFQLSGGQWIGGGDVKLGIGLGLLSTNVLSSILLIFSASIIGLIITVPLLLIGKMSYKTKLPFGPLLCAAAIFVQLFGAGIIAYLKTHYLLV